MALEKPSEGKCIQRTYNIWRARNGDVRPYLDANKLANVQRDVIRNQRLSEAEIRSIRESVKVEVNAERERFDLENEEVEEREVDEEERGLEGDERTLEDEESVIRGSVVENDVAENESVQAMVRRIFTDDEAVEIEKTQIEILEELEKVKHTDMNDREHLPKIQNNSKNKKKIRLSNEEMRQIIKSTKPDITGLNEIIYATAKTISPKCSNKKQRKQMKRKKPAWKEKIEKEIEQMRRELSILTELKKGVNVKGQTCRKLKRKYNLDRIYNIDAEWIKNSEVKNVNVPEQAWEDITSEDVNCALTKAHKRKSPGKDKVSNFWLEALNESHSLLAE